MISCKQIHNNLKGLEMIFAPEDIILIKVLMVDDDPVILDVVKIALERDGDVTVETALSARAAMELLDESSWDVIISDYLMPETDGIKFLKAVRSQSDIPFIILTGKSNPQVIVEAINNGANGYIQKDDDAKILFAKLSHQVREVTKRHRAEEALKKSEDWLRLAIDGGTLGIWDWDIVAGDIAYSGSLSLEAFGYSSEEFKDVAKFWWKFIHHDDLHDLKQAFRDHFHEATSHLEANCRLKSKYGEWMWAHIRGEVMSRDKSGCPLRMVGILQDITEQKEAENRIEHLNLVLQSTRNVNKIVVREKDPERLIKEICEALVETRGYHNAWIALTDESGRFTKFAESGLGDGFSVVKGSLEQGDLTRCVRTALNDPKVVIGASLISTCEVCPFCKIHAERGVLTARLESDQKIYGIISVTMPAKFVLDEDEIDLFEELAGDVAFALHGIEKENTLLKSQKRLKELELIVNNSPTVAFTWQASEGWPVEFVSENVKQFGYAPEDLYTGRITFSEIIHPDDLDRVVKEVAHYSQEGTESFDQEYRIVTPSGDVRWVSDLTWIRRDSKDNITHYRGVVLDITDRKQAEEKLRLAHQRLFNIIEYLPDATFAIDQNGTVIAWNRAIEKMTSISKKEMIGKGNSAYALPFYGTERPILIDTVFSRDLLEKNYQNIGTDACSIFGEAFTPNIYDGKGAYLWGTASPIFDEDGNVIGAIESIRDVTDRKRLETELCTEREKFQVLSESAPFGMAIIDENGLFEYINPKFEELFGYHLNDIPTGREWFRKAYPDPVQRHDAIATWIYDMERHDILEKIPRTFTVCCKDGRNIIACFITVKLPNGKYLMSCEDVTGRKQAEDKLRHAHQQLMDIIDFLPDPTFVVDQNQEVIAWNRAIEKMTGVPKEEIIGKGDLAYALPFYECKRPMLVDLIISNDMNSGQYYDDDIKSLNGYFLIESTMTALREGKGAHVWAVASLLLDVDGNVSGAIESIRDVTEWRLAEEALKESEARYRAVVDSQVDAICRWLPDTTLTFVNAGYCFLVGKTKEELLGQKWAIFVPKEVRNEIVENYVLLSKAPKIKVYEHEVMGIDGQIHYVEWIDCPILDSQGKVTEFQSVGRDLTARRRAEEALKESEERLELAVEAANFGIWDWNLRTNNVIRNDRYVEILGFSAEELEENFENWMDRLHPEDRPFVLKALQDHIEEKSPYYEQVYRIRREDGRWIWMRGRGKLVAWDEKGRPLRMAGVALDITERKQSEEELRKSKEILDKTFSSLDTALFILDFSTPPRILNANPEAVRMFGYEKEEMIGQEIVLLHVNRDTDLEFKEALYSKVEDTGYLSFFEFEMKRKNGEVFPTENSVFPLEDEIGNRIGWISVMRDITRRKEAEEALRRSRNDLEMRVQERTSELESKNAEMERFVYTVSHDLRSPLFTIQGFVGFLKEDMAREDQDNVETDLRMIGDGISKMDHLLKDTLELSRIGRIANPPEEVYFGEIVQETLDQISETIRQNRVEIVVKDNWPSIYVDRLRIGEVLTNLVENSIKYMGNQQNPRIEIGWRNDDGDAVFFVKDNGIGIDPTQQDKVFDLFYKVDGGSEGTGAGLAIVKRIIEVHGGIIWIESELGGGCAVCFTLGDMR